MVYNKYIKIINYYFIFNLTFPLYINNTMHFIRKYIFNFDIPLKGKKTILLLIFNTLISLICYYI